MTCSIWPRFVLQLIALLLCTNGVSAASPAAAPPQQFDIVVYGATSAGVVAAVEAADAGYTVALVGPSGRLGGLTTGGLGATDFGNKGAIGGRARRFYEQIHEHYGKRDAWRWQTPAEYAAKGGRLNSSDGAMWAFEPHVAEAVFADWIARSTVELMLGERLDRDAPPAVENGRIKSLPLTSGRILAARMFIDCTYEGDLMAWAGVSFVVGREGESQFGESLAGIQTEHASAERYTQTTHPFYHQPFAPLDPFVVPGDPTSGFLPGIEDWTPAADGTADPGVQAYCLRMCLTDVPENRLPWTKPPGYDPQQYEVLLRLFDAGETRLPLQVVHMPNRKTDMNNNGAVSTDYIGGNAGWATGSDEMRAKLFADHLRYQQGLMWTLASDPRTPVEIRRTVNQWGPARDEFRANAGWPPQLYVREARRMVSDVVMTQHHCQRRETVDDSVGLAAYQIDSHHVHRYYDGQRVLNEGMLQIGGIRPYPISYRAIVPRATQCTNLLVPVCLSATHVAYGSIRMEPVFMVLGQSSAMAARLAIESDCDIQDIDYKQLRAKLLEAGQRLDPAS